jgi:hypothetical protein
MDWTSHADAVEIRLPITTPTCKVRVKRPHSGRAPNPVACRTQPLQAGDYLEWQISYDTPDQHDPSLVPEIIVRRNNEVRYGCELVRLMIEARSIALLPDSEWVRLRRVIEQRSNAAGIEDREEVIVARAQNNLLEEAEFGFTRFVHHVPDYIKRVAAYGVEIKIAPKQRAVGTQAMVYVHLPVAECESTFGSLVGRIAEKGEKAGYRITRANAGLIADTALAFILASRTHARDMNSIFEALAL